MKLIALTLALAIAATRPLAGEASSSAGLNIASQYDPSRSLGFSLRLEGDALQDVSVVLGVGDGQRWRTAHCRPGFVFDRDYALRAVVAPDAARLLLDGNAVAESTEAWQPAPGPVDVNYRPPGVGESNQWLAIITGLVFTVTRSGSVVQRLECDFSDTARRPVPLHLLARRDADSRSADLKVTPGDTVSIDVSLRFGNADLAYWAPFFDRYGQARFADWPGKVHQDEDLRRDVARDEFELSKIPPSADHDEYGGYRKAGWREDPSGFYRVVRRHGCWWLVTPEGNPCFYVGVCVFPGETWPTTPVTDREFLFRWLPPREDPWMPAWSRDHWGAEGTEYVCFYTCNLIRKYGPETWREQATTQGIRRLRAWGFSGGGKWGAPPNVVSTPVLSAGDTPRLVKHPDVFDPSVCDVFRAELERQIAPQRDDPHVLGWSLGNEYNEIISRSEIRAILAKPHDTPAKRALLDYTVDSLYGGSVGDLAQAWRINATDRAALYAAKPKPPADDLERLRCFYADRYYDFIYRTVKSIDPNHLYLGFWIIPGTWQSDEDWRLIARHCDVIGYDRYAREYDSPLLRRIQAETDKPTFCGEFGFPAYYDGIRGFGRYPAFAADDAEAGELYYRWVKAAAEDPYCVGMTIFQYRDQPVTGRGPGRGPALAFGEHYAFGLVTDTDRPKWEFVRRARAANLRAARWRLDAAARPQ